LVCVSELKNNDSKITTRSTPPGKGP
jgi:hypothetical protein